MTLRKGQKKQRRVYLDYAAGAPVAPSVLAAMMPFFSASFGNPSALYRRGRMAAEAVLAARKQIATLIGCRQNEVVFTAGGTESDNLALFGAARRRPPKPDFQPHLVISSVEHPAVKKSATELSGQGYLLDELPVDRQGRVSVADLSKMIKPATILVSVMAANNEIGTVQPIREIGKMIARANRERSGHGLPHILFHSDACQATGSLPLNVDDWGVDLLTVNGSKIYGPQQIGFLYVRGGVDIAPQIFGGDQESGVRGGTENVPGIVGLAAAFSLACRLREKESRRQFVLQDYLCKRLLALPEVALNGPRPAKPDADGWFERLPNNLNFMVRDVEAESLMFYLDAAGFEVATGSACASISPEPSAVLKAIGLSDEQANSSIRISIGRNTKKSDLEKFITEFKRLLKYLK